MKDSQCTESESSKNSEQHKEKSTPTPWLYTKAEKNFKTAEEDQVTFKGTTDCELTAQQ